MDKEKKLKLIDLSQPVFAGCPRCPADPPVQSECLANHRPDGWLVERLSLTPHTGSHLDAPLHKLEGGPAIDAFPLNQFVGPAFIVDYRECLPRQPFTSTMLSRKLQHRSQIRGTIILIATGWGDKRSQGKEWDELSPFLSPDGADWLVEQDVRGVGIDHYSIGGSAEPSNSLTHQRLLEANIWIVEELHFPPEAFHIPQPAMFWCLPIHLRGFSGAFCRPALVVDG